MFIKKVVTNLIKKCIIVLRKEFLKIKKEIVNKVMKNKVIINFLNFNKNQDTILFIILFNLLMIEWVILMLCLTKRLLNKIMLSVNFLYRFDTFEVWLKYLPILVISLWFLFYNLLILKWIFKALYKSENVYFKPQSMLGYEYSDFMIQNYNNLVYGVSWHYSKESYKWILCFINRLDLGLYMTPLSILLWSFPAYILYKGCIG